MQHELCLADDEKCTTSQHFQSMCVCVCVGGNPIRTKNMIIQFTIVHKWSLDVAKVYQN